MVNRNPRQVQLNTNAQSIIKEDMNRTALTISNLDPLITVYFGYSNDMTSSSKSFPIVAGEDKTFLLALGEDPRHEMFLLAASGTPTIAIKEDGGEDIMQLIQGTRLVGGKS